MAETQTPEYQALIDKVLDLERKVQDMGVAIGTNPGIGTGTIIASMQDGIPGFLKMDGATQWPVADYPNIGALCVSKGLTLDGGITFVTPNLCGKSMIGTGVDGAFPTTLRALLDEVGTETVTLTGAQSGMPQHLHTVAATTGSTTPGVSGSTTPGATGSTTPGNTGTQSANHVHDLSLSTGLNPAGLSGGGTNGYLFGFAAVGNTTQFESANHTHASAAHTHTSAAHTHTAAAHTHTLPDTDNVAAANAAQAHNNMQPSMAFNFFVKT